MSWEYPAYSFGNPNAQPPTPTKTPTSVMFPSPTFHTPLANSNGFELHSGWTPKFAEEYSVFNATPGRLIAVQQPALQHPAFVETIPRPSTASSNRPKASATADIAQQIASHANHTVQTTLQLPPVDPSRTLSSSPNNTPAGQTEFVESQITPRNQRRRLQEAFSGQTTTPPESVSNKHPRRVAANFETPTMQRDGEQLNIFSTPGQQALLDFSNLGDVFSYPAPPATAPAFTQTRNFWGPDTSMGGMEISGPENTFFHPAADRLPNSYGWGRSNQVFAESSNLNHFTPQVLASSGAPKRNQPLAAKSLPLDTTSRGSFQFGGPLTDDPFSATSTPGAVDPGLLFTIPPNFAPSNVLSSQPLPQGWPQQIAGNLPYQHQQFEYMRDREELRRSQSTQDLGTFSMGVQKSFSSPAKGGRPGIQRSMSDSRTRRVVNQKPTTVLNPSQRPAKGRTSPVKQVSRPNLESIPEAIPRARTSVSFTIDAYGRAHTQTTRLNNEIRTMKGGPVASEDEESPYSESSSDEEPIIVPSRNSSFTLPSVDRPNLGSIKRSRTSLEGSTSRIGTGGLGARTSSSSSLKDQPSEAETLIDEDDGSGDAKSELRRVMEQRKRSLSTRSVGLRPRAHTYGPQSMQYPTSSNASPSTMTDTDFTPSARSDMSDVTRCVCNMREGDGLMIQCESCEKWLHASCVGVDRRNLPKVYICAFCAHTPNMRGGRIRDQAKALQQMQGTMLSSPLAHKGFGFNRR